MNTKEAILDRLVQFQRDFLHECLVLLPNNYLFCEPRLVDGFLKFFFRVPCDIDLKTHVWNDLKSCLNKAYLSDWQEVSRLMSTITPITMSRNHTEFSVLVAIINELLNVVLPWSIPVSRPVVPERTEEEEEVKKEEEVPNTSTMNDTFVKMCARQTALLEGLVEKIGNNSNECTQGNIEFIFGETSNKRSLEEEDVNNENDGVSDPLINTENVTTDAGVQTVTVSASRNTQTPYSSRNVPRPKKRYKVSPRFDRNTTQRDIVASPQTPLPMAFPQAPPPVQIIPEITAVFPPPTPNASVSSTTPRYSTPIPQTAYQESDIGQQFDYIRERLRDSPSSFDFPVQEPPPPVFVEAPRPQPTAPFYQKQPETINESIRQEYPPFFPPTSIPAENLYSQPIFQSVEEEKKPLVPPPAYIETTFIPTHGSNLNEPTPSPENMDISYDEHSRLFNDPRQNVGTESNFPSQFTPTTRTETPLVDDSLSNVSSPEFLGTNANTESPPNTVPSSFETINESTSITTIPPDFIEKLTEKLKQAKSIEDKEMDVDQKIIERNAMRKDIENLLKTRASTISHKITEKEKVSEREVLMGVYSNIFPNPEYYRPFSFYAGDMGMVYGTIVPVVSDDAENSNKKSTKGLKYKLKPNFKNLINRVGKKRFKTEEEFDGFFKTLFDISETICEGNTCTKCDESDRGDLAIQMFCMCFECEKCFLVELRDFIKFLVASEKIGYGFSEDKADYVLGNFGRAGYFLGRFSRYGLFEPSRGREECGFCFQKRPDLQKLSRSLAPLYPEFVGSLTFPKLIQFKAQLAHFHSSSGINDWSMDLDFMKFFKNDVHYGDLNFFERRGPNPTNEYMIKLKNLNIVTGLELRLTTKTEALNLEKKFICEMKKNLENITLVDVLRCGTEIINFIESSSMDVELQKSVLEVFLEDLRGLLPAQFGEDLNKIKTTDWQYTMTKIYPLFIESYFEINSITDPNQLNLKVGKIYKQAANEFFVGLYSTLYDFPLFVWEKMSQSESFYDNIVSRTRQFLDIFFDCLAEKISPGFDYRRSLTNITQEMIEECVQSKF